MNLETIYGEDLYDDKAAGKKISDKYPLSRIFALDCEIYSPEYAGELKNMQIRYKKNPHSFVGLIDRNNCNGDDIPALAGYINFFPCEDGLYKDIISDCDTIRDDDITTEEVALYRENGENHIFILSIVISRDYQNKKEVITQLTNAFIDYLYDLNQKYPITDITATAISKDGQKALTNLNFRQLRYLTISHDGNERNEGDDKEEHIVYICDGKYLNKLLNKDLYIKTYKDDIYLMLPLADHKDNWRLESLFEQKREIPEYPSMLMHYLDDCIKYECENDVADELEMVYLDAFDFLHGTDEYKTDAKTDEYGREEPTPFEEESVIGIQKGYAILTAHRPTNMYILTIFFANYPFSTTQLEDQLSNGYIKIVNPNNKKTFVKLYDYLHATYGLHKCGEGKVLLCMSNQPTPQAPKRDGKPHGEEFQNILSAEVFNSMYIDYHIKSNKIKEMCEKSYAQYDYYDVFLSNKVIAFILTDEYPTDIEERISITATYAFIAALVLFQNTSLAKINIKVTNALANSGEISLENVLELEKEFGKTVRFWEIHNFKYTGTQNETTCITEAFENKELKATYDEHQEFLEHIVELKAAQNENRNNMILNIVATILAIIQIQPFVVELLQGFYASIGVETVNSQLQHASSTFNSFLLWGSFTLFILIIILRKRNSRQQKKNLGKG